MMNSVDLNFTSITEILRDRQNRFLNQEETERLKAMKNHRIQSKKQKKASTLSENDNFVDKNQNYDTNGTEVTILRKNTENDNITENTKTADENSDDFAILDIMNEDLTDEDDKPDNHYFKKPDSHFDGGRVIKFKIFSF